MSARITSVKSLREAWNRFFFEPEDVFYYSYFRIAYAAMVFINFAGLYPNAMFFWSNNGTVPIAVERTIVYPHVNSLLFHLPQSDTVVWVLYGLTLVSALCLMVGFYSRVQAILLYVLMVSFDHRNILLLDGQDTVMRITGFLVIFFPLDRLHSIDRTRALIRGKTPIDRPLAEPWAIRTLQLWACFLMLASALWKSRGNAWVDGTAMYYVSRLNGFFGRLPVPHFPFEYMPLTRLITWSVLVAEGIMPLLLWVRETRLWALGVLSLFSLGCDYAMNLYLFHWLILLNWTTFLSVAELKACARAVGALWRRAGTAPRMIRYDGRSQAACRFAAALRECDLFGLLHFETADPTAGHGGPALAMKWGTQDWASSRFVLLRCLLPFPTAWASLPVFLWHFPRAVQSEVMGGEMASGRAA